MKFVKGVLKPILESITEKYDLVRDGKAKIRIDVKGNKTAIAWNEAEDDDEGISIMSFETKSVRAAVKEAVAKLES